MRHPTARSPGRSIRPPRFTIGVHYPDAWDAGSEFNSEDCTIIPGPPCGNGGVRDTEGAEGYIYIHNGLHGIGDVPKETYDWRNPAVRVEIQRVPPGNG